MADVPDNWSNTGFSKTEVLADFRNDTLTHDDIAQKHGKSWDQVQRKRSLWRRLNGYGPVPLGPKVPKPSAPAEGLRDPSVPETLIRIEDKLDEILAILKDI